MWLAKGVLSRILLRSILVHWTQTVRSARPFVRGKEVLANQLWRLLAGWRVLYKSGGMAGRGKRGDVVRELPGSDLLTSTGGPLFSELYLIADLVFLPWHISGWLNGLILQLP